MKFVDRIPALPGVEARYDVVYTAHHVVNNKLEPIVDMLGREFASGVQLKRKAFELKVGGYEIPLLENIVAMPKIVCKREAQEPVPEKVMVEFESSELISIGKWFMDLNIKGMAPSINNGEVAAFLTKCIQFSQGNSEV